MLDDCFRYYLSSTLRPFIAEIGTVYALDYVYIVFITWGELEIRIYDVHAFILQGLRGIK